MATNSGDYIVDQALRAYESYCDRLPRHLDDNVVIDYNTAKTDLDVSIKWICMYKRTHRSKWWRLMSHDGIVSCLSVLPLNPESLAELAELVWALQHGIAVLKSACGLRHIKVSHAVLKSACGLRP
jgi:hypothetical protein